MKRQDVPSQVNFDKSESNKAVLEKINVEEEMAIVIGQCKYLSNLVEQDYRQAKNYFGFL